MCLADPPVVGLQQQREDLKQRVLIAISLEMCPECISGALTDSHHAFGEPGRWCIARHVRHVVNQVFK